MSEAESITSKKEEYAIWPVSILTNGEGAKEVVSILVMLSDTVRAIGFYPDREAWVQFEQWDSDTFDREESMERINEWVDETHEEVVSHSRVDLED